MLNTSTSAGMHDIDGASRIAFIAQLDADVDRDGELDTGVYLYQPGKITTVVRTGTVIPGLGAVSDVDMTWYLGYPPVAGVDLNDRGEVLTQVIMADGSNHVVIATPK